MFLLFLNKLTEYILSLFLLKLFVLFNDKLFFLNQTSIELCCMLSIWVVFIIIRLLDYRYYRYNIYNISMIILSVVELVIVIVALILTINSMVNIPTCTNLPQI